MWNRLGALILLSCLIVGCGQAGDRSPNTFFDSVAAKKTTAKRGEQEYLKSDAKKSEESRPASLGAMPAAAPQFDVERREQISESRSTESYAHVNDNKFLSVLENPLSTFSIDVDTAAYSNMRRFISQGQLPPRDAVRIEELINYFPYSYPQPVDGVPYSTNVEIADCPWNTQHRLVRVGLKGREISHEKRPVSNLVFLLDVSGSMQDWNKLPLLKTGLRLLVEQLTENDRVAIVVYAGASGVVLDSTTADHKQAIASAIENLQAGGSTNGAAGIELAYQIAQQHFVPKGTNRVILCTDGDFNVGITDQRQLVNVIQEKARSHVFLSVLGFGMGNYKDSTLEVLADKGNGNYAYIDNADEAKKVLVDQMQGTLITIAKDVKIQIEFNPAHASAYRLIGYENRLLAKEDFNDDTKDAGEIGAGHTVTALYEVVPTQQVTPVAAVDPLKYQSERPTVDVIGRRTDGAGIVPAAGTASDELLTLKLRYKQPEGETSQLIEVPVKDAGRRFSQASTDFAWVAAVAAFGMILRDSEFKGNASLAAVLEIAQSSKGEDANGYRAEFIRLIQATSQLKPGR
jgi:Ca-activated chloride channel family protein